MTETEPERARETGRAGELLPGAGDMGREPGGVRVEAYRLAAEGLERR